MLDVALQRTRHLRLALQDVHDPHNVGACLRSADAFGIQNVDIITLTEKFPRPSSTSRGSRHWMDLHRFNDLTSYAQGIKARGFKIAAAYPAPDARALEALPLDQPLVLVFGNEQKGLHPDWQEHIDYRFTIPMYGMVESFNISVSVALTLHSLNTRGRRELPASLFHLTETERHDLLCRWACMQCEEPELELARKRLEHSPC
jgi:tRNA (guanosine-2'-O-)-methyltransferase